MAMKRDPYEIRHLIPVPPPLPDFGRRTREHRCGRCSWGGSGSTSCPRYLRKKEDDHARGDVAAD